MPEHVSAPKVLISYSHDSRAHMARVLSLSDRLRDEGIDSQLDQYETSPPEGWPRWTLNQVEWADFVLVVCTETYHRRFRGREEEGKGRGVNWEGVILTQDLYDQAVHNTKFIPVVFEEADAAHIPVILRGKTFYVVSNEEGYEALYRHLTNQPRTRRPVLGKLRPLPQRARQEPGEEDTRPEASAAVEPESEEPAEAPAEARDAEPLSAGSRGHRRVLYLAMAFAALVLLFAGWRFVYMPLYGRGVEYSGTIFEDATGKTVRWAAVRLKTRGRNEVFEQADSDGRFFFRLSQGDDVERLRVEADGFAAYERSRPFRESTNIEIRLTRNAAPPTPTPTPTPTPRPSPSPSATRRPIIPRPVFRPTP